MYDSESEISDSIRFCSEYMAEMYGLTIEKAKVLTNSPFPRLLAPDSIAFGHISY